MPSEIVKRVGTRAYRYAVESVADPRDGIARRRWRYLGPVAENAPARPATRDRLLDAFERLLEDRTFEAVTVSAIGTEASLAHGTFYRHFADKAAALDAAIGRIRAEVERADARLEGTAVAASAAAERSRIDAWLVALTSAPAGRSALIRAWYLQRTATGDLAAERRVRRAEQLRRLSAYLTALDAAGLTRIERSDVLAIGIYAAIDGTIKRAFLEDEPLDERSVEALRTLVSRAIFGAAPAPAEPAA